MKTPLRKLIPISVLAIIAMAGCSGGGGGDDSGGGDGTECGGSLGNTCTATQFCKFADLSCGALPESRGTCKEIPVGSCDDPVVLEASEPTIVGPVCSCDRLEFKSECWSTLAGQSVELAGGCP